ncbi:MAG: cAMP-activated global transcriptional regulator CRP [Pseudomonadota bacterium]
MDGLKLQVHDPLGERDSPQLEAFLAHCHRRKYPSRSPIIRPGDVADTLYFIIDGSVSVSVEDDEGHELILAYLNAGDFIGEMGIFMPQERREVMVRTRTACELAQIAYPRLEQLLNTELSAEAPFILYSIGCQLSDRLLHTSRKVRRLAFLDVTGRIARTLLDLCKEPDAMTHPEGIQIRISRQEISRIVGCSREMAGRVLKTLEQEGMVSVSGKTIVVYDAEK